MRNTPDNKKFIEWCGNSVAHSNTGYSLNTWASEDGEYIYMRITKPKDNDFFIYPDIYFSDNHYGTECAKFEISVGGHACATVREAEHITNGLNAAITLVNTMQTIAEVLGITVI